MAILPKSEGVLIFAPKIGDKMYAWLAGRAYKIHIVAIVDGNQIVFKWYGKHKQWWHYQVLQIEDLEWRVKLGIERLNEQ